MSEIRSQSGVKGANLCGAKCRTKGGAPCLQAAMANGRSKMHGGCFYKKETHGRSTIRAKAERKREQAFIREMVAFSKLIDENYESKTG